ncbi:4'-phosphopantetheinyl transferase family protein [Roseovarius sp. 2305UL8-3]|uniref:4'-phosphopantetheinyl transferase family protein n=1 Tax=Roseovarius conchicola TaxID=3121636 RepID=UPI003528A6CE
MNDVAAIFAPDTVVELASGLLPDAVEVAVAYPWEAPDGLWPEETASLSNPVDKRLREFAAGRRAARQAMSQLDLPAAAIPHGSDRAPVWPRGVVGSLSHTDTICVAVVAHSGQFSALGLDIEEDADLPRDLWPEVLTPIETAWLSVQPEKMRGRLARLIFSAKECAYKLQYPITGKLLGFGAFDITLDVETGQIEATLTDDVAPFVARTQFAGRFAFGAGLVLTAMALPRSMRPA